MTYTEYFIAAKAQGASNAVAHDFAKAMIEYIRKGV